MSGIKRIIDSVFLGKTGGKAQVDNRKLARILHLLSEASGTNNAVPITYAALKALYDAGKMIVGRYEITDFRSVLMIPGTIFRNIDKRGDDILTHSLIVEAISPSILSKVAFDTEFPNDVVHYDITGAAGYNSYPTDGSGKGIIYYRQIPPTILKSTNRLGAFSEFEYDVRNAIVPVYAVDLTSMNGNAITHCSMKASHGLYYSETFSGVTSVALDLTDYDADTNNDGVKYVFQIRDNKSCEGVNGLQFRIHTFTNDGENGAIIPLFYMENTAEISNVIVTGGIYGQFLMGYNTWIENTTIMPGCGNLTFLNTDAWNAAALTGSNFWAGSTRIFGTVFDRFSCFFMNTLCWGYENPMGIFGGQLVIKGSSGAYNMAKAIKINKCESSKIFIDCDHADYYIGWGSIGFENCNSLRLIEGNLAYERSKIFRNIGIRGGVNYVSYDNFVLGASYFQDTENNGYLPNCKTTIDFAGGAIANINLSANWNSIYKGYVDLTNGTAGSMTNLGVGVQKKIFLMNNTGANLTLNDGGATAGAVRFPSGVTAPKVVADGEFVVLENVNSWWVVQN